MGVSTQPSDKPLTAEERQRLVWAPLPQIRTLGSSLAHAGTLHWRAKSLSELEDKKEGR
jgi:hypothetical protein